MLTVGVRAQFHFQPGSDAFAEKFFQDGQLIVEGASETTVWYAFRVAPDTYGAFAAFASEQDRDALLAAGGPELSGQNAARFLTPPTFEKVDIVAARNAGSSR